jgi:magnesium transporter
VIRVFRRTSDGRSDPNLPLRALPEAVADSASLIWVDVESDDRAEGERVLGAVFHFHPLTIDDCYNTLLDPPKVDDYGDYLFVIIHDVQYDERTEDLRAAELDLYIGPNYVVSFHKTPVATVEEVRRQASQNGLAVARGAGFLAHALFDGVVDGFLPVTEAIDDRISAIEEAVLEKPDRETLQELLRLRRDVQRLRRTILPQRDVANRFAHGEYDHLIPRESLMYYRDIYDHTVRVEEMIEGVRDVADSAVNTYLSSVNNRTNEVMKTLAIAAAIFLPLTLIAGIYGTNFENVPEYGMRYAYAGMWIAMCAVAAALIGWFKWRGWF